MTSPHQEAEDELRALGFSRESSGEWVADVQGPALRVRLPAEFPFVLPTVTSDRAVFEEAAPHIERNGKVCIVSNAGILLDPARPRALVHEAVDRARAIVSTGLAGTNRDQILDEFSAYWGERKEMLSFCSPTLQARAIAVGTLRNARPFVDMIAADSRQELKHIVEGCGLDLDSIERGFIVPLTRPLYPPKFEIIYRLGDLMSILNHTTVEIRRDLLKITRIVGSRIVVLFVFALNGAADSQIWFALRLARPLAITPGFRASRATLSAAVQRQRDLKMQRANVQRADPQFLQRRIGAQANLRELRVGVIGCGAIGGFVAVALASAGITKLTLIDDDGLRADNAMRHFLGISEVGIPKVTALRAEILRRLPHMTIETRPTQVQKVMSDGADIILDNDLLVLATGDHALELYISSQVRKDVRLVHAWVEALGVGGHVLLDAQSAKGCLRCLYDDDDEFGLICRPSLFAPGQSFTSQLAGCAGAFTPFGVVDAQGVAIEATRLALRTLSESLSGSVLITRYDSSLPFRSGQYRPSSRAMKLTVGSRVEITEHATGCSQCAT